MTESALTVASRIRVFYIPPTPANAKGQLPKNASDPVVGQQFPWAWTSFVETRKLIPISSTDVAGGMGQASFQLLRATRQEIGDYTFRTLDDQLVTGCWIAIATGSAPYTTDSQGKVTSSLDPSAVLWVGWVSSIDGEQLAGTTEVIGGVHALGLGHLLDKRQIYGWQQGATDPNYGTTMNSPPAANIAGAENQVIGNCVRAPANVFNGNVYLFTRMPSEAVPSTYAAGDQHTWTRWRLLNHLVSLCQPDIGPGFKISIACVDGSSGADPTGTTTIAGALNDTTIPETFDLQHLTWKGALDLLIPDSRGYGWYLTADSSGWTVNIYTVAEVNTYGVPVNTQSAAVNLPSEPITSVTGRTNADDLPDELVYESAEPIVFGLTIGGPDKNLVKMWSAAQETAYKAAASGASGYGALSTADQKLLNAAWRNGPGLHDVFTKFGFNSFNGPSSRDIARYDPPITTQAGGKAVALIPEARWDGTTLKLNTALSASRTPYLLTTRFLNTIPWPVGMDSDGTDNRDAFSKAQPQYHQPKLFVYDSGASPHGGWAWMDLLAQNGRPNAISLMLHMDDRSPAIRVTANPPELLAYKHWSGSPSPAVSDVDPETAGAAIDYATLVATVAVESDQRIQVIISRPGAAVVADAPSSGLAPIPTPGGHLIRRSMIVRDDKLHCWLMLKNSILGMKPGAKPANVPDLVTGGPAGSSINDTGGAAVAIAIRNDWAVAQRRANQLAAFVFRKRTAVSIGRARVDDQPTWARLGTLLTKLVEVAADSTLGEPIAEVSIAANTVVVECDRRYGQQPRMTVSTGMPALLNVGIGGGGSPSSAAGGPVGLVGGGTIGQQVADLRARASDLERDTVRSIVVPPKGGSSAAFRYELKILDGNTVFTSGPTTIYGIKLSGSQITTVPSLYDPNSVGGTPGLFTAIDGIGRAQLWIDGVLQSGFVLVVLDTRSPIPTLLAQADSVRAESTVSIPLVSDASQTVVAYLPLFV